MITLARHLCCLLLCWISAGQASAQSGPERLYRGEVLFESLQGNHLDALLRLESGPSKTADQVDTTALRLAFGISAPTAETGAVAAVSRSVDDAYRLAAFYYYRDQPVQALQVLDGIQSSTADAADHAYLRARALIGVGRFAEAADLLERLPDDGPWAEYLQYNRAIAELQTGNEEQAVSRLASLGQIESRQADILALRDMANMKLAYHHLQAGRPQLARTRFSRIPLQGPFTDQALLGTGWASFSMGKIDRAIVAWTLLHEKDAINETVIEAKMALPYAYSKLGAHGKAANLYAHAIKVLETELSGLDASLAAIRNGDLRQLIVDQAPGEGPDWFVDLARHSGQLPPLYLPLLLSDGEFRRSAAALYELARLRSRVARARNTAAAAIELGRSKQKHYAASRSANETELFAVVDRIKRIAPEHNEHPAPEIRALHTAYNDYLALRDATAAYQQQLPATIRELKQLSKQLQRLDQQLTQVIGRSGQRMEAVATSLLEQRRKQLESYHGNALFALAESYDLATGTKQ